jgi:hypothetical protein
MGVVAIRCISMSIAEESILLEYRRKRVRPEKTVKRGAPKSIKRKMKRIGRKLISPLPVSGTLSTTWTNAGGNGGQSERT